MNLDNLTPEQMTQMMKNSLKQPTKPMTQEEKEQDDAEHGYFQESEQE